MTRELKEVKCGKYEIDSLMSVVLEDTLPVSIFDGCILRFRVKMCIEPTGYIDSCEVFGDLDSRIKSYVVNVLKVIKFNPAIKNGRRMSSAMSIIVKLDFTKVESDIKRKLFSSKCSVTTKSNIAR